MVGPDGKLPLPWLAQALARASLGRHAHALLVHGPQGVGQFELAVILAQARLCDRPAAEGAPLQPCGVCASCRLVQARSHPDLLVVLPEALRESLGWASDAGDDAAADRGTKAKPSKEIKVDAVRAVVGFAQTTSARGRGKAVVLHPAERLNAIAANTLLKTLEEPAGDLFFVLSCAAPEALLPTIRSRCQALPLGLPLATQALQWLAEQGVERADVLLRAAGGQPLEALEWAREGMDAQLWLRLPERVAQGDAQPLAGWPLPRAIDALQKLCHDATCAAVGAAPRYVAALPPVPAGRLGALIGWSRALSLAARHADHPWSAALLLESLVEQGREALSPSLPPLWSGGVRAQPIRYTNVHE